MEGTLSMLEPREAKFGVMQWDGKYKSEVDDTATKQRIKEGIAYELGRISDLQGFELLLKYRAKLPQDDLTQSLAEIRDGRDQVYNTLLELLDNKEDFVFAVKALGNLGDERAVAPLISKLEEDPDTIATSLAKLGSEGLVALTKASKHSNSEVRKSVAKGLRLTGSKEARERLVEIAFQDIEDSVRREATLELVGVGDPRAIKNYPYILGCVGWPGVNEYLANTAPIAPIEALRAMLGMSDVRYVTKQEYRRGDDDQDLGHYEDVEWGTISYSSIRRIGMEELQRRGLW